MEKEIEVMKRIYSVLFFIPALLFCLSCNDQLDKENLFDGTDRIVCAEVSRLSSDNSVDDNGEETIESIRAYLFDEGVLVKKYTDIKHSGNRYEFPLDALRGNLYIVANDTRLPDFGSPEPGYSEEEWKATVIHSTNGQAEMVYTGVVSLADYTAADRLIPVSLKRVAARFDLRMAVAGTAEVKSITFKRVQKAAYLFPQSTVATPEGSSAIDIPLVPEEPYTASENGILYLYEQDNADLKVALNASIDGKEYSLETNLPEKISRNTVYSITLRKDVIDAEVQLTVEEWKDGGDTTLKPGIDDRLVIDSALTELPGNVTVANEGSMLILPHLATDFIVAIQSDSELEVFPVTDPSLTVEPVSPEELKNKTTRSLAGINLFRIRKKLYSPNIKTVDTQVYFHRKGLTHSYPEDNIHIRMTGNPTTSQGALEFGIDTYTHNFNRYIDNEFAIFTLPAEKEMLVEFADGEDRWIRIDNESGRTT